MRGAVVKVGDVVSLGIRPEHMAVSDTGVMKAIVRLTERLGSETMLHLVGPNGSNIIVRADGLAPQKTGELVNLSMPSECCHLFDAQGNVLVNGALI